MGDKYCMAYGLGLGAKCGMDAANEYAGICASPNGCVNGVCGTTTTSTSSSTTTSSTTTSTVTTSTTTTLACIASAQPCWDATTGPVGSAFCCTGDCPVLPGSSANCP